MQVFHHLLPNFPRNRSIHPRYYSTSCLQALDDQRWWETSGSDQAPEASEVQEAHLALAQSGRLLEEQEIQLGAIRHVVRELVHDVLEVVLEHLLDVREVVLDSMVLEEEELQLDQRGFQHVHHEGLCREASSSYPHC